MRVFAYLVMALIVAGTAAGGLTLWVAEGVTPLLVSLILGAVVSLCIIGLLSSIDRRLQRLQRD